MFNLIIPLYICLIFIATHQYRILYEDLETARFNPILGRSPVDYSLQQNIAFSHLFSNKIYLDKLSSRPRIAPLINFCPGDVDYSLNLYQLPETPTYPLQD